MAQAISTTETEEIGGFTVVGLSARLHNKGDGRDGGAAEKINALWGRFFEEAAGEQIPSKDGKAIYAVYHDYAGGHKDPYTLTIGCRVRPGDFSLPTGFSSVTVPKAHYAVFAARGEHPKALLQTWEGVWKSDLPRSYACDLEIYGPRFFEDGLHEILVCVGVRL
jgi:predicted transcriptional regulator YdeE